MLFHTLSVYFHVLCHPHMNRFPMYAGVASGDSTGGIHSCCHLMCSFASAMSMHVITEGTVNVNVSNVDMARCSAAATSSAYLKLSRRMYLCASAATNVSIACGLVARYTVSSAPCSTENHTGDGYPMVWHTMYGTNAKSLVAGCGGVRHSVTMGSTHRSDHFVGSLCALSSLTTGGVSSVTRKRRM